MLHLWPNCGPPSESADLNSNNLNKPSELLPSEDHSVGSVWDEKLIANLVEVSIAMGYGEGISEEVIDSLLANKTWGADYIEYWQELIHRFDGNPVAIVETLAWRSFAGDLVGRYLDLYEFGGANTELNIDRVSDVGPMLYLRQKPLLASYSLVPPFLFELCRVLAPYSLLGTKKAEPPPSSAFPTLSLTWRPVGDSNPCCRDENPVS